MERQPSTDAHNGKSEHIQLVQNELLTAKMPNMGYDANLTFNMTDNENLTMNFSEPILINQRTYGLTVVVPLSVFLVIIMILAIVGNSMVILTIFRHKRMRTRTNMFITNLAISDIMTAVFDMPVSLVTLIEGRWIFGEEICQFNGFTMALFIITSIYTLMYISIHKCISITRPFSRFMTKRRILFMIMGTWLWSFAYAFGAVVGWNRSVYKPGSTQCGPSYPDNLIKKSHSLVNTTINFFLPLIILSVCYVLTFNEIRHHMVRMVNTSNMDNTVLQQKRIAITLFMVMACFLICLTPYVGYSCSVAFSSKPETVPMVLNPISYWCIYVNAACNPIIYAFRSPAFRQGYKEIMCGKAVHYLSGGSFRSTSQQSWSFRSSVRSSSTAKGKLFSLYGTTRRVSDTHIRNIIHGHVNGSAGGHMERDDTQKYGRPSIESTKDELLQTNNDKLLLTKDDDAKQQQPSPRRNVQIILSDEFNSDRPQSPNKLQSDNEKPPNGMRSNTLEADKSLNKISSPNHQPPAITAKLADKEDEDTFYDSDVEMEHHSRKRERRLRRRRQSRSVFVPGKRSGGTVSHLVKAQTQLMNINTFSPTIPRPHSLSDLRASIIETQSAEELMGSMKEFPIFPIRKTSSHCSIPPVALQEFGKPLTLTQKLANSLSFFRRSKDRSLDKFKVAVENVSSSQIELKPPSH